MSLQPYIGHTTRQFVRGYYAQVFKQTHIYVVIHVGIVWYLMHGTCLMYENVWYFFEASQSSILSCPNTCRQQYISNPLINAVCVRIIATTEFIFGRIVDIASEHPSHFKDVSLL